MPLIASFIRYGCVRELAAFIFQELQQRQGGRASGGAHGGSASPRAVVDEPPHPLPTLRPPGHDDFYLRTLTAESWPVWKLQDEARKRVPVEDVEVYLAQRAARTNIITREMVRAALDEVCF